MNQIHFSNLQVFFFFWIIPAAVLIFIYAAIKRKQALEVFARADILGKINLNINKSNRLIKLVLLLLAMFMILFAAARPGWDPQPKTIRRQGRDVVFLLDVSKSMLAEDLTPNRMEQAKLAILDCIEVLQGDRVGLVVFAGSAVIKCPLTLDYGFFRSMVEGISINSVTRGGTNIGDSLRLILNDVFDDQSKKYKDIILITDGEDHDSAPEYAAEEAGKRGIRILAIGLGDEQQGARIPVTDETGQKTFLKEKDETGNFKEVWTRLDADMLRKLANLSAGGNYLNVATGSFNLGEIYTRLITSAEKKDLESATVQLYAERFQPFLVIALLLLVLESALGVRRRKVQEEGRKLG